MGKVVSIEKGKCVETADRELVPMYEELAAMELQVKMMRGKILARERQLLPKSEAAHRVLMRQASKLNW